MVRGARAHLAASMALALLAAGCGGGATDPGGTRLAFDDVLAPDAYLLEARAERDAMGGAGGLWAAVPDLARPERAVVFNAATGEAVIVALFRSGSGDPPRVSHEAAEAIEMGEDPALLRFTAIRREARLESPRDGF